MRSAHVTQPLQFMNQSTTMSGPGKARRTLQLVDEAITILAAIQPASVRAVCD
jgi:hypothetical protein